MANALAIGDTHIWFVARDGSEHWTPKPDIEIDTDEGGAWWTANGHSIEEVTKDQIVAILEA